MAPSPSVAPYPHSAPPPQYAPPAAQYSLPSPGQETRIRVSVKLSVRDPNLLIARPLAHGEPPPPGTREATLLLVEPAAEPATSSNGEPSP